MNADVVLRRMSVGEDGRLVLPDGMSYRVLVLPQIDTMTPAAAPQDPRPGGRRRNGGRPETDRERPAWPVIRRATVRCAALASELWGDLDGVSRTRRVYGKGRVAWGQTLGAVLDALKVPVDFESQPAAGLQRQVDPQARRRRRHLLRGQSDGSSRWISQPASASAARTRSCGIPTAGRSSRPNTPSRMAAPSCRCG